MQDSTEGFLNELEAELNQPGRQVLPRLKGLYRALVSVRKGYWDPKARRTKDDFAGLSPTELIEKGVITGAQRSRFQTWFLVDSAAWPNRSDEKSDARALLKRLRDDPRWARLPQIIVDPTRAEATPTSRVLESPRDRYFDALLALLQCKQEIQSDLARRASGVYLVYRPSIVYPTRYVRGLLACFVDRTSGALLTMELHRMKPAPAAARASEDGIAEQTLLDRATPTLEDILLGCMVQKSRLIQIHSVDLMTRSFNLTYLRTALRGPAFPDPEPAGSEVIGSDPGRYAALDDERVMGFPSSDGADEKRGHDLVSPYAMLSGTASGTVGGAFFAYPCVYSRIADLPAGAEPTKSSAIYDHLKRAPYADLPAIVDRVPPFVLEQLRLSVPPAVNLPPVADS